MKPQNRFYFLSLLLLISFRWINSLYAQPGPQNIYGSVEVVFTDENQKPIYFKTSDSITFLDKKFKLRFYLLNEEKKLSPLRVTGWGEPMTGILAQKKENSIRFSYLIRTDLGGGGIGKSIVKAILTKKDKTMVLLFDFTDNNDPGCIVNNLRLPFQLGLFKVTQSCDPKLIPVKE